NLCTTFKCMKPVHHKQFGQLQFLPVPAHPWSSISMDFIEELPTLDGFNMILVVVNHLTKMALFMTCHKEAMTLNLTDLFLCNVFAKHRTPTDIVSNFRKLFTSQFWSLLCDKLHIKSNYPLLTTEKLTVK